MAYVLADLKGEHAALSANVQKASAFIESDKFFKLDELQRNLLRRQLRGMVEYQRALHERIETFKEPKNG